MPDTSGLARVIEFGREVAIIVLGVAIALLGQAGYESIEESRRHRDLVAGLRFDLEADTAFMSDVIAALEIQTRAATRLMEAYAGDAVPRDSVAALLRESRLIPFGRKSTATYDAMVAAGDLRLFDSSALRRDMVGYYSTPLFREAQWLSAFLSGPVRAYDRAIRVAIGPIAYDHIMNCPTRTAGGVECLEQASVPGVDEVVGSPGFAVELVAMRLGVLSAIDMLLEARRSASALLGRLP